MEAINTDSQAPYGANPASEPPSIDNIHQTGGASSYRGTPPAGTPQHILPYTSTPPTMTSETNGASPMATASHAATPPNTTSTPAGPKDGKSAAQPDFPAPLPSQASAHGAPVRQYLNENVAPYFLEVSKYLAAHRPEKPLEFVAEYFTEKSRQIEGDK